MEMTDYQKVVAMLEKSAEQVATKTHTRYVLSQKDCEAFYKENGVTKDMLTQIKDVETKLTNGAYTFGGQKLVEEIKAAKKAGKPTDDLAVEVVINSSKGPDKLFISAHKTYRNPQDADKPIDSFGSYRHTIKRSRMFDKVACDTIQEQVKKALGK